MSTTSSPPRAPQAETQPTPAPWLNRPSGLIATDGDRNVRFIARVEAHGPDGQLDAEDEANAELIVVAVNNHAPLLAALERINMLACYASEENTDARAAVLVEIGHTAREAIANAERKEQAS